MDDLHDEGRRIAGWIGFGFGVFLHAIVGVFVFTSGLIAPLWAVTVLIAVWLVAAFLLWQWRRSPVRTLAIPLVMAATWWAVVSAGDAWLGWAA